MRPERPRSDFFSVPIPLPSHLSGLQIWLLRHSPVAVARSPSSSSLTILQASVSPIRATSWRAGTDPTPAPPLQRPLPPQRLRCPSPCSAPMDRKRRKGRSTATDGHGVTVCPVRPAQPVRYLYQAKSPYGTHLSSLISTSIESNPIHSKQWRPTTATWWWCTGHGAARAVQAALSDFLRQGEPSADAPWHGHHGHSPWSRNASQIRSTQL